jgi:uncharacterized protein (DUF1697 family)
MSTYISMLRGINVGGQKMIRMETLRGVYTELGFTNIRTYVQSGNVVFESPDRDYQVLNRRIEAKLEQTCGYPVQVFIRQVDDFQRILTANPFLNDRNEYPDKLHVTFLYQHPPHTVLSKLTAPSGTTDEFAPGEMAVYLYCPHGYGKTKLSNGFFERKLGMPVTTRNWNTVNALYKIAVEG